MIVCISGDEETDWISQGGGGRTEEGDKNTGTQGRLGHLSVDSGQRETSLAKSCFLKAPAPGDILFHGNLTIIEKSLGRDL